MGMSPVQGPTLRKALGSVSCSVVAVLKFLIHFEQEALHFSFALSPTHSVAGPASGCGETVRMCDDSPAGTLLWRVPCLSYLAGLAHLCWEAEA